MAKRALVVSGGGSKGAFAVGVISYLAEQFPQMGFDIFVGTSTGALVVPLVACNELPLLQQLYTTVTTNDIITKGNIADRILHNDALFDAQPLANLVKQYINDARCQQLFASPKELYIVTTCLQTCGTVVWSTDPPPQPANYDVVQLTQPKQLRRAILASANQPVFMSPIEVLEGANPVRQYVDGGVREYLGVQVAIDAGADEIFAIALAPPQREIVNTRYTKAFSILERTVDIFSQDVGWNDIKLPRVYNSALRYIAAAQERLRSAGVPQSTIDSCFNLPAFEDFSGKKPLTIHHIYPEQALGGGPGGLDFNPALMTAMMQSGRSIARNYMAALPTHPNGNV